MKVKTLIWILAAIAAVVFVFAKVGKPDEKALKEARAQQENLADRTIPVTTIQPEVRDIKVSLDVTGAIKSTHEVQVGAKVPGRLTGVYVKEGTPVRRGQTLAQVETYDLYERLQQALAAVEVAESARQQAQLQAIISPQQSQANIRQAAAGLSSAKARLKLVREGARAQDRNQAKERVNDTKARLDKAKVDLDRAKKLYAGDAISRADVDAAQLAYDSALANYRTALEALSAIVEGARPEELRQAEDDVRQAEEQLNLAKSNSSTDTLRKQQLRQAEANLRQARANVRLAQLQIADAAITAPVDGYVSGAPAQVGQVVNIGTPIATIVGTRDLHLNAQVSEMDIASVRPGAPASVRMDAFPNRVFSGTVAAVDPRADSLGRLFTARITIIDPAHTLRPGMFGKATLTLDVLRRATTIPTDAISREEGKSYVFLARDNKAKRVEVRLGRTEGRFVQVFGIATNDHVILAGKDLVTEGAEIREEKIAGGSKV
jgi:RND family efflux transporter MFP subunit